MKKLIVPSLCAFLLFSSCQTIEKGSVLGTHFGTVELKPDVTYEQWKSFVKEEYIPAYNKEFEGDIKAYFIEGERGNFEGYCGFFLVFQSVEKRNKYWPEFQKSTETYSQKIKNVMPVYNKLNELGEFKIESSTDWIVQ